MERFNQLNEKLASFTSAFLLADDHFNRFDQYKSIKFDSKDGLTHSMGMLVALDEETAKVVDEFLTENQPLLDAAVKDGRITKDDAKHLRRLVNQNFQAENREKSMVTFRDLKLLASIAPGRFRELALTGFMPSEQKMAIFDAERTPDLQVAYAARASMAAPLAFTSVTLNGVKYIDGGLGSNQPVDVVHGDKQGVELEESHARTVLFSFDANGEALKALHDAPSGPGFVAKYITNPWMWLWGKTDIAGADIADAARQNSMGPQTMVVYHGDLGSFSFLASSDQKDLAVAHSRVMMQEQLLQRENQGMSRVFETITDVVKGLDAEDKAAFLKAHAGIKFPDDPSEVDATTAAVYDLLKALGAAEAA
jgi:predicted acylesterase/phospholipase RssA